MNGRSRNVPASRRAGVPAGRARIVLAVLRLFAMGCAGTSNAAWANDGKDDEVASEPTVTFQHDTQVLGYSTVNALNPESQVNPDNLIAGVPRTSFELAPRVDLTVRTPSCYMQLKPRAFLGWQGSTPGSAAGVTRDAYLNEGRVSCQAGSGVNLEAGRSVMLWGSSVLLSPSNPFFAETGKINPVTEMLGRDMVRVSTQVAPALSVDAIYNFHVDSRDPASPYFSPVGAVKANWTGHAASASALISHRNNGVVRLGVYGTWTVSDALLLYGDASVGQGRNALFAVKQPQAPGGWVFAQNHTHSKSVRASTLVGGSYTLASGWTQTLELLYNGDGYSTSERRAYQQAIQSGGASFAAGNPAAAGLLGQALNPQQSLLGRRYAMAQLGRTDLFNKLDVTLRYTQALDAPRGGNLALSLNYKMSARTELFAFVQLNVGNAQSEFKQVDRFAMMSGVHVYLG